MEKPWLYILLHMGGLSNLILLTKPSPTDLSVSKLNKKYYFYLGSVQYAVEFLFSSVNRQLNKFEFYLFFFFSLIYSCPFSP